MSSSNQSLHNLEKDTSDPRDDAATLTSPRPDHAESAKASTSKASVMITVPNLMKAGIVLIIAFWINALWLFGSFYKAAEKTHQLSVIVADFDGAEVGSALLGAIAQFNGMPTYPNFIIYPANSTSPQAIHDKVWAGQVWGAIYATAGASSRFHTALTNATAAATYVPSDALVYTGLEVRYYTTWSGFVLTKLIAATQAAVKVFNAQTMVPLSKTFDTSTLTTAQAQIYFAPISSNFLNLAPFGFASKSLFNTIGTVLPILFQFFFLMTLNGMYNAHGLYKKLSLRQLLTSRLVKGAIWTLLASLSIVGWEVAFDEGHRLAAKNFFALWACTWIFAMTVFDLLDAVTVFVPLPAQVPIILSVIIMSVASTAWPIDMCNHWFRIHYAFPAHAFWKVNITAWSGGAANKLYYDLPVLAAWLIVGKVLVVFAMMKKVKDGKKAPLSTPGAP